MTFSLKRRSVLPLTLSVLIFTAGCDDSDDETTGMDPSTEGDGGGGGGGTNATAGGGTNGAGSGGTNDDSGTPGGEMDAGRDAGEEMDGGSDNGGGNDGDGDAAAMLTDAQIAAVVSVANMGEIAQANAALMKVQNQAVRDFAMMMVTMHTAAQARAMNLLASEGITPEPNPVSMNVKTSSDEILSEVQAASTAEVDAIYMRGQVTIHRSLLTAIDSMLLPSARSAALRAELQTTRSEVMGHLAMAESIVASL